jgi:hypothetical protein
MKLLKTAALTGIVIAAVVVLALEPASGAGTESNLAACSAAISNFNGSGWSGGVAVAGPVLAARGALRQMSRARNGDLYAKLPLLLSGTRAVTISVPHYQRRRVFLYYGRVLARDGRVTTSFADAAGYGETEFRPCGRRTQTVWSGGVRIKGTGPVHLLVHRGGDAEPVVLRLGRPAVSRTRAPRQRSMPRPAR